MTDTPTTSVDEVIAQIEALRSDALEYRTMTHHPDDPAIDYPNRLASDLKVHVALMEAVVKAAEEFTSVDTDDVVASGRAALRYANARDALTAYRKERGYR